MTAEEVTNTGISDATAKEPVVEQPDEQVQSVDE